MRQIEPMNVAYIAAISRHDSQCCFYFNRCFIFESFLIYPDMAQISTEVVHLAWTGWIRKILVTSLFSIRQLFLFRLLCPS